MTSGACPRGLGNFWVLRWSKTLKKWPHCPYFDTQEAVLGDWRFGGANEHQIQKFYLGWKVDRQAFQQAHLGTIWTPAGTSKSPPKWRDAYRFGRGAKRPKGQNHFRSATFRFANFSKWARSFTLHFFRHLRHSLKNIFTKGWLLSKWQRKARSHPSYLSFL